LSGRVQQPRERPSVTALTDALGRAPNHQANVLDLVSPTPGRVPFGIGLTIRFLSYREDLFREQVNSFARCFYAAIGNKPQGLAVERLMRIVVPKRGQIIRVLYSEFGHILGHRLNITTQALDVGALTHPCEGRGARELDGLLQPRLMFTNARGLFPPRRRPPGPA
jgi:hypothetical protein